MNFGQKLLHSCQLSVPVVLGNGDVELTVVGVLMIPHTERSNQPRKRCNVYMENS